MLVFEVIGDRYLRGYRLMYRWSLSSMVAAGCSAFQMGYGLPRARSRVRTLTGPRDLVEHLRKTAWALLSPPRLPDGATREEGSVRPST